MRIVGGAKRESFIRGIIRWISPYRRVVLVGFTGSILTKVFQLLRPYFLGRAVDGFALYRDMDIVLLCAAGIVLAACAEGVTEFLWRMTLLPTAYRVERDLRNSLFTAVLRQSHSWLAKARTGDIMSRATNDVQTVRAVVETGLTNIVRGTTLVVGAMIMMLLISPFLTLLAFLPAAMMFVAIRLLAPVLHRRSRIEQERIAEVSNHAQEGFAGIRVLKAYGVEQRDAERFAKRSEEHYHAVVRQASISGITHALLFVIIETAVLVILFFGGRSIIFGELTFGTFTQFLGYQMMLTWPMLSFGWLFALMQRGKASLERIEAYVNLVPDVREPENPVAVESLKGDVVFSGVGFRYPGATAGLSGVDLRIPAGGVVAVTGPVGSGKSTLAALLPRLYDVDEGSITIGGVDVRRIPLGVLRSRVGFAPQEPFLFSDTVEANVAFGAPQATQAQIRQACRMAGVDEDVAQFPDGYLQVVGERGISLSGGQKQRLSLARALLADPDVLVLDDTLSSVDSHKEEEILGRLKDYLRARTTVIIAHRLSTLRMADMVVVMEAGRVVQVGTHDELLGREGPYRRFFELQTLEERLEAWPVSTGGGDGADERKGNAE